MAQKPETKFRNGVVVPFLKGLQKTKFFSIQQVGIRGTPDILASIRGRFVAIEVKSEKGKLSKLQDFNLNEVAHTGGRAVVVNPQNWGAVKSLLTQIAEGTLQ